MSQNQDTNQNQGERRNQDANQSQGMSQNQDTNQMKRADRLIARYHAILAEADALPVQQPDEEAIAVDLILQYKERCKKAAVNYAVQGCYKEGNRPKKNTVHHFKKTREYRRRYDEALASDYVYQEIMTDTIRDDYNFRQDLKQHIEDAERRARREVRREHAGRLRKLAKQYMHDLPAEDFYAANRERVARKERDMGDDFIRSPRMLVEVTLRQDGKEKREELSADNYERFIREYAGGKWHDLLFDLFQDAGIRASSAFVVVLCEEYPFLKEVMVGEDTAESASTVLQNIAAYVTEDADEDAFIRDNYDFDRFLELLEENELYTQDVRDGMLRRERANLITSGIADTIPKHYPDLFPLARAMKRHFILHIGPTNSGKTYEGIEALKNADSGVYLAPLRLLAYEQYDTLNRADAACTLVTGEERREVDGARLRSSTIEMLDFKKRYDVAVIDEAQMMTDDERGGAWTAAIMGVRAKEIHVCAAPSAETLLKRVIEDCGDTWEAVYHERKTPLVFEHQVFMFPEDVKPGDALIVFSRRDVHAVAAELQKMGKTCSIIYGALPYDVRYEEARKFRQGETDIVVATDAIGMGLNMPVHRIVFLETDKFDGYERRELYPAEIQQIGGRAGRFGIFEEGRVNSLYDVERIEEALYEEIPQDTEAVVAFPEELLRISAPLSEILAQWAEMEVSRGFRKNLAESEIWLAKLLEEMSDDKYLIYRFVTMAFDETNEELLAIWREMFSCEMHARSFPYTKYLPLYIPEDGKAADLPELEEDFHVCDLLYAYLDRFDHQEGIPEILKVKEKLSTAIMKILEKQELAGRRCRVCGRPLSWNYPYGVCERCHHTGGSRQRKRRRR